MKRNTKQQQNSKDLILLFEHMVLLNDMHIDTLILNVTALSLITLYLLTSIKCFLIVLTCFMFVRIVVMFLGFIKGFKLAKQK